MRNRIMGIVLYAVMYILVVFAVPFILVAS